MGHGDLALVLLPISSKSESSSLKNTRIQLTTSIPYAPFQKSDKIHRIADWHEATVDASGRTRGGHSGRTRAAYGAGEANIFGYVHEEDEKSFSLVDSGKPVAKAKNALRPLGGRGRGGAAGRGNTRGRGGLGGRGDGRGGFGARRGGRYDRQVSIC
jgi:translation initiation factor 3 subunit D